jgi:hypothetical protein
VRGLDHIAILLIERVIPGPASFLFRAESLQQHLQLLEPQFEFLGHLQPRGFRDVRKVECYRSRILRTPGSVTGQAADW